MEYIFKKVAIIGRTGTAETRNTLDGLIKCLRANNINLILERDTAKILSHIELPTIPREYLSEHCDLIIVIGGDGSLLSAARIAARQNLPIVGINRGSLGFLTDISPNNIEKILDILAGKFYEEERFLLTVDQPINQHSLALNDIVFLSYIAGHMIDFSIHVDSQFVCNYNADGLIIATPTGSTAHALSGGGPILHPNLDAISLVPMLSHNLNSRPIVIKNNSMIEITFNNTNTTELLIRCDGQVQNMLHGNSIKIKKAKKKLRLLHPMDYNYFETLRTKLHWENK